MPQGTFCCPRVVCWNLRRPMSGHVEARFCYQCFRRFLKIVDRVLLRLQVQRFELDSSTPYGVPQEKLPTNQVQLKICWGALCSPALRARYPGLFRSLLPLAHVDSASIEYRYTVVAST